MANCKELKLIARARLKSAKSLMRSADWHGAAYMLAYTLEVALKAATCKTLHLEVYPEGQGKRKDDDMYFMTHRFDRLVRIAGLEDILGLKGVGFQVWSDFTKEYPGDWPTMRYDIDKLRDFDQPKVEKLYKCLADKAPGSEGILTLLDKKRRW